MSLEPDYTLEEVAEVLRMSTRWVRNKCKEGAEHTRRGHKILFTPEQFDKLRTADVANAVPQSITTGRKRRT